MEWKNLNDDWNREVMLWEMQYIKQFVGCPLECSARDTSSDGVTNLNDDLVNTKETIDNDTMNVDYQKLSPLQIIEHQLKIVNYLLKLFKINRLQSVDEYEPYLMWIMKSSEYLALSIHQSINRNKSNSLMRSSYKFCNKKSDCQSHYGFLFHKKTKCCMNDHYVHHKVVSDIVNLLDYLKKNTEQYNKIIVETELKKGLETINYVINHMYQELSSFMLYLGKSKYTVKNFYRYN